MTDSYQVLQVTCVLLAAAAVSGCIIFQLFRLLEPGPDASGVEETLRGIATLLLQTVSCLVLVVILGMIIEPQLDSSLLRENMLYGLILSSAFGTGVGWVARMEYHYAKIATRA